MLLTRPQRGVAHGVLDAPYPPITFETWKWTTESGVVTQEEMVEADKDIVQVSKRCKRLRDLAK